MAWPKTPMTTYNPSAPPAIKSADLNGMQSATNDLFNGDKSVKTLYADGTGAVATSAANAIASSDRARFADADNIVRLSVDYLGYPRLQGVSAIREHWITEAGASGEVYGQFMKIVSGTGAGAKAQARSGSPAFDFVTLSATVGLAAAAGHKVLWVGGPTAGGSTQPMIARHSALSMVAEFEVCIPSLVDSQVVMGLGSNSSGTPDATLDQVIVTTSTGSNVGNWNLHTADAATLNTVPTATAYSSSVMQRIRLELFGASTGYGSIANLWVNEVKVATSNAHLPTSTVGLYWYMMLYANGAAGHSAARFGPASLTWNRY